MALDLDALFTVVGKYVFAVNTVEANFATLETLKDQIFDSLEDEGLEEHYTGLPSQIDTMQTSVQSWIQTFITEVESVLTDEEYVLENLPIFETTITAVLNAIFDQMIADSDTIQASVVELGGADVDQSKFILDTVFEDNPIEGEDFAYPAVFLSRKLDGTNDPSALVEAHASYNNAESQLVISGNMIAKVLTNTLGSESLQLFGDSPSEDAYTADTESAGVGPVLTNVNTSNLISSNSDFSLWSGDNPTDWTVTGGAAGTDWEDYSGTGLGPLSIKTAGTYVKRQLTGLSHNTMYFFGAIVHPVYDTGTSTEKFRLESVDGATIHKDFGSFAQVLDIHERLVYLYGFYSFPESVNLSDVYLTIEHDAETDGAIVLNIYKAVVAPATYFNGLAWAFWSPIADSQEPVAIPGDSYDVLLPTNAYNSIIVENGNEGVFQTFFRKAFNIQLPTADSPTISDTLADF